MYAKNKMTASCYVYNKLSGISFALDYSALKERELY